MTKNITYQKFNQLIKYINLYNKMYYYHEFDSTLYLSYEVVNL